MKTWSESSPYVPVRSFSPITTAADLRWLFNNLSMEAQIETGYRYWTIALFWDNTGSYNTQPVKDYLYNLDWRAAGLRVYWSCCQSSDERYAIINKLITHLVPLLPELYAPIQSKP